jgi:hypothetical protein
LFYIQAEMISAHWGNLISLFQMHPAGGASSVSTPVLILQALRRLDVSTYCAAGVHPQLFGYGTPAAQMGPVSPTLDLAWPALCRRGFTILGIFV